MKTMAMQSDPRGGHEGDSAPQDRDRSDDDENWPQQRNDVEIADPRPAYPGASASFQGSDDKRGEDAQGIPSSYFWELTNLGGRKISYGFVPGLVMLWPCWLKYDIVPHNDAVETRTFITFAAKVRLAKGGATSGGVPVLVVPDKHRLLE